MKCESCDVGPKGGFVKCTEEAAMRIWCPTWVRADNGPVNYCERHAAIFRTAEGQFFYGDDADKAFKSVESFIPRKDERYQNAYGMVRNGTLVSGEPLPEMITAINELREASLYVVDGSVWMITYHMAVRLGKWPDVKQTFPKLF